MIFKNRIKKEKLLEDIEKLNDRVISLSNQVMKLQSAEKEVRRILGHHVHGQVVGFSHKDELWGYGGLRFEYTTYVYKNGKEYIFDYLYIENPEFEQGDKENIIYASSEKDGKKYVLDLINKTYIEI